MSVITVLEQEHGTELDLVQTQHLLVMAGNHVLNVGFGWDLQQLRIQLFHALQITRWKYLIY